MTTHALGRPALPARTVRGAAALAAVVVLWSTFALSSRALEGSTLTVADGALLRFAVPALALAPWIPRTVRALRGERAGVLALVLLAGLPHFLLFAGGADLTSAGLTGLIVPGTVPVFVTLLVFLRTRVAVPRRRLAALAAVVVGVAVSALLTGGDVQASGIAALVLAGFVWALYTVGLAATRLDLPAVMVVVSVSSTVVVLLLAGTGAMPSHLLAGRADWSEVGTFALLQGVGTGLLSTACYVVAVKNLGGSLAGAAGAMSPVLTALVAVPLLGEPVTAGLALALGLIVAGVVVFHLPVPARRARIDRSSRASAASVPSSAPNNP